MPPVFPPQNFEALDWIVVDGLEFDALIGIYPHERQDKQPLRIDLRLGVSNIRTVAETDDIALTVDYQRVCEVVMMVVNAGAFQLLETLVERVSEQIFAHFPVQVIWFRATKPHALFYTRGVGVEILRQRPPHLSGDQLPPLS